MTEWRETYRIQIKILHLYNCCRLCCLGKYTVIVNFIRQNKKNQQNMSFRFHNASIQNNKLFTFTPN